MIMFKSATKMASPHWLFHRHWHAHVPCRHVRYQSEKKEHGVLWRMVLCFCSDRHTVSFTLFVQTVLSARASCLLREKSVTQTCQLLMNNAILSINNNRYIHLRVNMHCSGGHLFLYVLKSFVTDKKIQISVEYTFGWEEFSVSFCYLGPGSRFDPFYFVENLDS